MPVIPRMQEMFGGRSTAALKRKAASVARKAGFEPVTQDGWTQYCWSNGGGDSCAWFFREKTGAARSPDDATGEILVLTFDHESDVSMYDTRFADQVELYRGLPAEMRVLVENRVSGDPFHSPPHSELVQWARPVGAEGQAAEGHAAEGHAEEGRAAEDQDGLPAATTAATGIFWFDGQTWWITDGLQEYIDSREGLELLDTGIGFCLRPFLR